MKVCLRAFELDDYRKINAWRQDQEVYRLIGGDTRFVSSERDRKWVEEKIFAGNHEFYWAICLAESGEMIGYLSLSNVDYRNGRAEWGSIVIGDPARRGQGYATQAIYLMLEYAFDELRLERVSGMWLDDAHASAFVARLMGFQQEGVLRRYSYKGGKHHDIIVMSMLKEEFAELKRRFASRAGE